MVSKTDNFYFVKSIDEIKNYTSDDFPSKNERVERLSLAAVDRLLLFLLLTKSFES